MKRVLTGLAAAALVAVFAVPGAAQSPSGSASPSSSPSGSASPSPSGGGLPSGGGPSPSGSASPSGTPLPSGSGTPLAGTTGNLNYAAVAGAVGMETTIQQQGLITGLTEARAQSGATQDCAGVACATAAGAVEPFGTTVTATSPNDPGPKEAAAFDLGADASEEFEQALVATLGSARAATGNTPAPVADADAGAAHLEVTLTQTLVQELPPELTGGLEEGLGALGEALAPIAEGDPSGTIAGLVDQLTTLIDDLAAGPILEIDGGVTRSDANLTNGVVNAFAVAQGTTIVLLPTPESTPLLPEGLVTIEVGESTASATTNGSAADADFQASVVRLVLLPGILDAFPDIIIPPPSTEGSEGGSSAALEDLLAQFPEDIQDLLVTLIPDGTVFSSTGEPPANGGTYMQVDEEDGLVIEITPNSPRTCIAEDQPIETCIIAGGGEVVEEGAGAAAVAAGVSIEALITEGVPTVELKLAYAEAGVNAQVVAPTPRPTTPVPTTVRPLPQTGGGIDFFLPAIVLVGLSALSIGALRRRR